MRGPLLWLLLTASATAWAQTRDSSSISPKSAGGARLSVERAAGAELCPDRAMLERRIANVSGHRWQDGGDQALAIEVRFERTANGAFEALVSATGPKPGQRRLRDANPTCDALGEAVTVAIALLLDSVQTDRSDPVRPPPKPSSARTESTGGVDIARRDAHGHQLRASLEAGGAYGLGGGGAWLGGGRLGLRLHDHWLFDLGALGSLPTESSFERGTIRTALLFGSARACYLLGQSWTVAPCVQLGVGRLHGEGSGYAQALSSSLPWIAAGLGLAGEAPLGNRLSATWGATLWVPTRRQTFSVENAGIAWESKPIAGQLTAGLGFVLF